MPRQGHLVNALHIMSYLKIEHNYRLVLDPSYPGIDMSEFKSNEIWAPFYGDVQEAKPLNAPNPLGKVMSPDEASYFQTIIGMMRWMVELSRIYRFHLSWPCQGRGI